MNMIENGNLQFYYFASSIGINSKNIYLLKDNIKNFTTS